MMRAAGFALAAGLAVTGLPPALAVQMAEAQPTSSPPPELRVVKLHLAAEEMYRAQPGWETTLRQTVKTVSDIYERNFQIRLVVQDVVPWTAGPSVPIGQMFVRLRREVPLASADVLVGFAAERCERLHYGVARLLDRFAFVQTGCPETAVLSNTVPEAVLSHEIAHIFGAFHPALGVDSVMRGGPADRFDSQTLRVIRLTRDFDFSRGVLGLDSAVRRAWSAIYAEGHARNEANPLAGAVGNAGWALVRKGKTEEGEALLREAVTIDPTAARLHTMLGLLHGRQGRLSDAVRELETAKRLDFREAEARTELGFVLMRLGREEEALAELRDVVRLDRRVGRAYVGIGMILAKRDRVPEAIGAFTHAIQVDARDGIARLRLAEALDRINRPAEAWAEAEQSHRLGEDVPANFWQRLAEKLPTAPPLPPTCAGAPGAAIDLESPEPAYREYVAKVRERIRDRREYPRMASESALGGELQIELRLARDGRLDCVVLRRSSGSDLLDRYTLHTVRLAQPFPAIPPQIPLPVLVINGTFRYPIVGGADAR